MQWHKSPLDPPFSKGEFSPYDFNPSLEKQAPERSQRERKGRFLARPMQK